MNWHSKPRLGRQDEAMFYLLFLVFKFDLSRSVCVFVCVCVCVWERERELFKFDLSRSVCGYLCVCVYVCVCTRVEMRVKAFLLIRSGKAPVQVHRE